MIHPESGEKCTFFRSTDVDELFCLFSAMKDRKEQLPTVTDPPVKLQFNMGPAASSFSAAAVEKGYLSLRAQGINLRLLTSSLTNITDLIEDEQLGEPLPMLVEVTDSLITLKVTV